MKRKDDASDAAPKASPTPETALAKAIASYEAEAAASFEEAKKVLSPATGHEASDAEPPAAAEPEEICTKANAVIDQLKASAAVKPPDPPEPPELQFDHDHDDVPWQDVLSTLKSRCVAASTGDGAKVIVVIAHDGKTPVELATEACVEADQDLRGAINGNNPNSSKARGLRTKLLRDHPRPTSKSGWETYLEFAIGAIREAAQKGELSSSILAQLEPLEAAFKAISEAPTQAGRAVRQTHEEWSTKAKLAVLALDGALFAFASSIHSVKNLPKARKNQLKAAVFGRRPGDAKRSATKQDGQDKPADPKAGKDGKDAPPPAKT